MGRGDREGNHDRGRGHRRRPAARGPGGQDRHRRRLELRGQRRQRPGRQRARHPRVGDRRGHHRQREGHRRGGTRCPHHAGQGARQQGLRDGGQRRARDPLGRRSPRHGHQPLAGRPHQPVVRRGRPLREHGPRRRRAVRVVAREHRRRRRRQQLRHVVVVQHRARLGRGRDRPPQRDPELLERRGLGPVGHLRARRVRGDGSPHRQRRRRHLDLLGWLGPGGQRLRLRCGHVDGRAPRGGRRRGAALARPDAAADGGPAAQDGDPARLVLAKWGRPAQPRRRRGRPRPGAGRLPHHGPGPL